MTVFAVAKMAGFHKDLEHCIIKDTRTGHIMEAILVVHTERQVSYIELAGID